MGMRPCLPRRIDARTQMLDEVAGGIEAAVARTGSTQTLPLMKFATKTCRRCRSTTTWQGSVPWVSCRFRNVSSPVAASTAKALTVPVGWSWKDFSSLTA